MYVLSIKLAFFTGNNCLRFVTSAISGGWWTAGGLVNGFSSGEGHFALSKNQSRWFGENKKGNEKPIINDHPTLTTVDTGPFKVACTLAGSVV